MLKIRKSKSILINTFLGAIITTSLIELSEVGAGFADMLITTHMLGSDKAAAIGIAYPVFSIVGVFSGVLALGMQLICSEEIARGNYRKMNQCFSTVFTVGLIVSLLLVAVFFLFEGPIVKMLGAKQSWGNLYLDSKAYIKGLVIGLPPLFLYPVLVPAVQLDGGGKLVRISAISSTIVDIVFNYIFIKAGGGMFGVGFASGCSYYVNFIIMLIHFTNKNRQFYYKPKDLDFSIIKDVVIRGKSKALKRVANFLRPIIINNYIISIGGAVAMSALSIRNNTADFIMVIGVGIAGAVVMLSSISYSEKNKSDIVLIGKTAHKCVLLIICPISILILIFANAIAGFLVADNTQLKELVAFALRVFSVEYVADIFIASRIAFLVGTSKIKKADILTICQKLIFIVPCVLILGTFFGVKGIIASFAASYILILLSISIFYSIKNRKIKLSVDDYLLLDKSFDDSPKNTVILEIRNLDDASLVAEQIQLFCKGHKFERKKSYWAALCMEETIFSLYSENNNKIPEGLEIYCKIYDYNFIMRFRYNENLTNSFSYDISENPQDEFEKIGVKIIKQIAKDIKIFNALGMNYVVICV